MSIGILADNLYLRARDDMKIARRQATACNFYRATAVKELFP